MTIEVEILGNLLYKPSLLNEIELKSTWFKDTTNQEIAYALIENDGQDIDTTDLAIKIQETRPLSLADAELLQDMRIAGMVMLDVHSKADSLKELYFRQRLAEATHRYSQYPDAKNLELLKERMMEMDSVEKPEDDGNLEGTIEALLGELETDKEDGILTYPQVDEVLGGGMHGGMLVTIGARTGVGKTAYGINLACQALAKQKDVVIDFFTLEMSKMQMTKRFISRLTEINSYKLRNPNKVLSRQEKNLVTAKAMEVLEYNMRIHDNDFSLKQIERRIRMRHHQADGRPYVAFVDYIGLIDAGNSNQPRHVQVGEITRLLKMLTNELDIPIVLFSQLNRAVESRDSKKPNLSDLRESGSVEQDSSVVMFLHMDEETQETIVTVAKNREGHTGDIFYNFLKSKMYFQELDR